MQNHPSWDCTSSQSHQLPKGVSASAQIHRIHRLWVSSHCCIFTSLQVKGAWQDANGLELRVAHANQRWKLFPSPRRPARLGSPSPPRWDPSATVGMSLPPAAGRTTQGEALGLPASRARTYEGGQPRPARPLPTPRTLRRHAFLGGVTQHELPDANSFVGDFHTSHSCFLFCPVLFLLIHGSCVHFPWLPRQSAQTRPLRTTEMCCLTSGAWESRTQVWAGCLSLKPVRVWF